LGTNKLWRKNMKKLMQIFTKILSKTAKLVGMKIKLITSVKENTWRLRSVLLFQVSLVTWELLTKSFSTISKKKSLYLNSSIFYVMTNRSNKNNLKNLLPKSTMMAHRKLVHVNFSIILSNVLRSNTKMATSLLLTMLKIS